MGCDATAVEHLRQNGCSFIGHAFGHRRYQKGLIRLRQQTRLCDGAAGVQSSAQVQATQQALAVDVVGQTPYPRTQVLQQCQPFVAHRSVR